MLDIQINGILEKNVRDVKRITLDMKLYAH